MTNGNTYDKAGRILSCEHATSRVSRDDGSTVEVLASYYNGLELTLLGKDFVTPNGLCLGLDESVLFVADTQQQQIRRFRIEGDTSTSCT